MKVFFCLILCLAPLLSFGERLILSLGEKTRLPLPADLKVRIGDKSLARLQTEEGWLSLLARKEGQTKLIAGSKKYEIFIFPLEKKKQALLLDQLLKKFWGLDWSLSKEQVFQVRGRLNRLSDWLDLAKTARAYHITYEFKAQPGEGLKKTIQHYFNQLFQNKNPPDIVWQKAPLAHIPRGANLEKYETLLHPFGLTLKEDPLWLSTAPFIEIQIALVESSHSSGLSLGGGMDSLQLSFSSLLGFLNFLKSSGRGKTLHHSSIMGQSGQKLQIQSGGQIPFNLYNFKTEQKNVQWKSHGLSLSLTPKAGKKNQIELNIKAQISEPLALASIHSPPPLKTQRLENTLVLTDGEILTLFHLEKQSQGWQGQAQLGALLNLPGSLFRSNHQHKTSQFIFIQAKKRKKLKPARPKKTI